MNLRSKILLTCIVLVAATSATALVSLAISAPVGRQVCQWKGGKWGSARNECITRACYASGDCGSWLRPSHGCRDLGPGASISEVYFRLGNPGKVEGNTYTWFDGKPDPIAFTAIIENGVLISLNCL